MFKKMIDEVFKKITHPKGYIKGFTLTLFGIKFEFVSTPSVFAMCLSKVSVEKSVFWRWEISKYVMKERSYFFHNIVAWIRFYLGIDKFYDIYNKRIKKGNILFVPYVSFDSFSEGDIHTTCGGLKAHEGHMKLTFCDDCYDICFSSLRKNKVNMIYSVKGNKPKEKLSEKEGKDIEENINFLVKIYGVALDIKKMSQEEYDKMSDENKTFVIETLGVEREINKDKVVA
jgi:hypothetical protein